MEINSAKLAVRMAVKADFTFLVCKQGRGTFLIQSSKFTECSSRNGGAVMASNVLKLSVASCDFEKNEASLNGGALGAQADEVRVVNNSLKLDFAVAWKKNHRRSVDSNPERDTKRSDHISIQCICMYQE